jgi:hypothetical protein
MHDGRFQVKPNPVGGLTSRSSSEVEARIDGAVDRQHDEYQQDEYVVDKLHTSAF